MNLTLPAHVVFLIYVFLCYSFVYNSSLLPLKAHSQTFYLTFQKQNEVGIISVVLFFQVRKLAQRC